VVTAGGTQEPIDPVRVITNRSSGKQGFALAQAALDLGAEVSLIAAPNAQSVPVGVQYIPVGSAAEMEAAVLKACQSADALLMAAAVADFTPTHPAGQKIKKQAGVPRIELIPTNDILAAVATQRTQSGMPRCIWIC
jgi:phosphopantothenoylcysteine decarboxylase/phosphopantothenate--cysteine ligase